MESEVIYWVSQMKCCYWVGYVGWIHETRYFLAFALCFKASNSVSEMLLAVSHLMYDITLTVFFSKSFMLLKQDRLVVTSKVALFDMELTWTEIRQ